MGAGLTLFTVIPTSMLGIVALYFLPNLVDPFTAYPELAINHVPFPIGAALLMGVLGASMSTANGGLLAAFKKLGFTSLTGVDPSPACALTTAELGVESLIGSLFDPPVDGRRHENDRLPAVRCIRTASTWLRQCSKFVSNQTLNCC